ncbi:MHYT domain-containing protein [Octadecabacter sp. 1_MG-2023]|uniref:MHYT domain-containing protein n=1 Tax=unclassified Octadecabacter TaxID=196158 RepID=UPI001C07FFC2|nr:MULTISPECIES: MHYT domain-containing protein [unclassified Octadecabacter]MBU2993023.1 LytTR family transcriptional regulator DNA-binding domain-containing protein [Octadecabacter sp. B2R22]MDO6733525.1 MHYT domain-containing protein [Octadecabacter sp. 1_MG-2023]
MEFLDTTNNTALVLASIIVALVAGFTGLTLSKDLSTKSVARRKVSIAMSSIALGGGIWSMHFVAMLGIQMPILFYYDAAITLASALLAILIVGTALLLLHFRERTPFTLSAAGALVGCGILAMHYIGMAGLQLCRAVYTPLGILLAVVSAVGLCIAAFWIAYGRRTNRNILLGTLCFGTAVSAVHFAAMAGTNFIAVPTMHEFGPVMSNETLAMGVILSSFVIFGAFLWMGVTFFAPTAGTPAPPPLAVQQPKTTEPVFNPAPATVRIPCDHNGVTKLIASEQVAFVQAEGHYTNVFTADAKQFCGWPITEAITRLEAAGFIRTHRSYLVNPAMVNDFERLKDTGVCRFASPQLPSVPVSRSHLKGVRDVLGL